MRILSGLLLVVWNLTAQNAIDTPDEHLAAAKVAAGDDFQNLLNFQCYGPGPGGQRTPPGGAPAAARGPGSGAGGGRAGGRGKQGPPDKSTWYAEPVKVFDNLYFF